VADDPIQVKIFRSTEDELEEFEQEINDWLAQSRADVVNIFGNIAPPTLTPKSASLQVTGRSFVPSDVLIVIAYRTSGG
jgi:hypothetical protein